MSGYMKKCIITLLLACVAVLCFGLITEMALNNASDVSKGSITTLNHIVKTAGEHRDDLTALEDIDVDFVIVDAGDHLLYSHVTEGSSPDKLSVGEAIEKRYPYSYLSDGGKIWGAAILLDDPADAFKKMIFYVTAALIILVLLMGVLMILYGLYIRKSIVMPFRNMKDFAAKVAQGKLDEPLRMDKDNMFGVFSESFDIMREELAETKERELELQKKERELVASLSHDLKTPVTGIKLTAERIKMLLGGSQLKVKNIDKRLAAVEKAKSIKLEQRQRDGIPRGIQPRLLRRELLHQILLRGKAKLLRPRQIAGQHPAFPVRKQPRQPHLLLAAQEIRLILLLVVRLNAAEFQRRICKQAVDDLHPVRAALCRQGNAALQAVADQLQLHFLPQPVVCDRQRAGAAQRQHQRHEQADHPLFHRNPSSVVSYTPPSAFRMRCHAS